MGLNGEVNDDMISLSTLQSIQRLWVENAGALTLLHAQKGQDFSYLV